MKRVISCINAAVIALLLIGGYLVVKSFDDLMVSFKPAQSFDDLLEADEIKEGMHIKGNVVYVYDTYASMETWTENKNGSRTPAKTSSYYYVIPGNENFLGLEVPAKLQSGMNTLMDETFDYMAGGAEPKTEVLVEGRISKMSGDLLKYYHEWMQEGGLSQAEIDEIALPLVVEYRAFSSIQIMFGVGVLLIGISILIFCIKFARSAPKKEVEPAEPQGPEL